MLSTEHQDGSWKTPAVFRTKALLVTSVTSRRGFRMHRAIEDWEPFYCAKETDRMTYHLSSFLVFPPLFWMCLWTWTHHWLHCHRLINLPMPSLAAGRFFHLVTLVISTLSGGWQGLACGGSERGCHKTSPPSTWLSPLHDCTIVPVCPSHLSWNKDTHTHTQIQRIINFATLKITLPPYSRLLMGFCIVYFPNFLSQRHSQPMAIFWV